MEKVISFKFAKIVSIIYALYSIIGSFGYNFIGTLLLLVIFPYTLSKLKQLLFIKYGVNLKILFNIVILIFVCSVIIPIIIPILYIVYILLFARGVCVIILSLYLIKGLKSYTKPLIITIFSLIVYGFHTIFLGILSSPLRFTLFPQITVSDFKIFQNLLSLTILLLFGSLFFVFNGTTHEKDENNAIDNIE